MVFSCVYYPKTQLIKALYSLDSSSRPNGQLSQNPKTGGFKELFLSENDFKTCSTVNFPEKHPDFGGLEANQRHEIQTWIFFHMAFYIWTRQCFQPQIGTSLNCNRIWGQNFKNSWKGFKKLNSTIFWALYFFKCQSQKYNI